MNRKVKSFKTVFSPEH